MIPLFVLFTVIPALDLWLLVKLGGALGAWNTVFLTVFISLTGASLAKAEGAVVLRQMAEDAAKGVPPAGKMLEGAMVFAGGLFLFTPGLITDTVGLLFLFPPTRRLIAPRIGGWFARRVANGGWVAQVGPDIRYGQVDPEPAPRQETPPATPRPTKRFDHPVA